MSTRAKKTAARKKLRTSIHFMHAFSAIARRETETVVGEAFHYRLINGAWPSKEWVRARLKAIP